MAQISKAVIDSQLREFVFTDLKMNERQFYYKINDRQYGTLITDGNGHERYVRIGVIVAEEREGMTAKELMDAEIADYQTKQANKAEKAAKKAEKIAKDKAKREAAAKAAQEDGE